MSQEAQAQEQAQAPNPPVVPLIIQYHQQLAAFKHQREQAKVQFEQCQGAVFACEQMIKQYEDNAKQAAMDLAKKAAEAAEPLTPSENLGEINDGQANSKQAKQVAPK